MSEEVIYKGLTTIEVEKQRQVYGKNIIEKKRTTTFDIFIRQFKNIFVVVLITAAFFTFFTGDTTDGTIILGIIILSGILGFINEFKADKSVKDLTKAIKFHCIVIRNGEKQEIDTTELVPGDIVSFENGTVIPADLKILEANALEINEAALTGESFPVDKKFNDMAFMGTVVTEGYGEGEVIAIGSSTEFGKIAKTLQETVQKTSFEKGITQFSSMVFRVIVIMAIFILFSNLIFQRPLLDSILFSLSIAIGLTPELLPAVITVSLATGMQKLLKKKVIVKHMTAIENLGNMDILCTDKTGTLTEGQVNVNEILGAEEDHKTILAFSLLCNSAIVRHKIIGNPIDIALWKYAEKNKLKEITKSYKKVKDFPFNFVTRLMHVIVEESSHDKESGTESKKLLIVKGAPEEVFAISKDTPDMERFKKDFATLTNEGQRIIAIAVKEIKSLDINIELQKDFNLMGLITLIDRPKKSAEKSIKDLKKLGVEIKILTGDNELISEQIAKMLNLPIKNIITGRQFDALTEQKKKKAVIENTIFAKVTPIQKAEIIKYLKANDLSVGYMGDGINDAASLKMSDVGISVDTAVDIAKDTADIVLLKKDLDVLVDGIIEGRKTFSNTIKYILMNISSNFGNMFSMAGASLILPFLPMLPGQILLNNLLYDTSQLALPTDNVDEDNLEKPDSWNIKFIRNFMLLFGPISSIFDFLTFFVLLNIFHADEITFHTGWFTESIATQMIVVFIIRTKAIPFFKSKPSLAIFLSVVGVLIVALALPFTSIGQSFGFTQLSSDFFVFLVIAVIVYAALMEVVKYFFYKNFSATRK